MTQADQPNMQSSGEVDLSRSLRRARRAGLFDSLARIYADFPETTCEDCARCCFESPGIFFLEYLNLIHLLSRLPSRRRATLLDRTLRELFFSWIEPDRQCIFLDSSRCAIYSDRPLACRLFGIVAPAERDRAEAQARLAARQEAERLRLFGIEIPEAVVRRSLAGCDRVRDRRGRPVHVDGDAMAARVARLDSALLPREVVVQEFCFLSLPERLGAAALGGEAVAQMRLQLLRRAQRGETIPSLLRLVRQQARLPALLAEKRRRENR